MKEHLKSKRKVQGRWLMHKQIEDVRNRLKQEYSLSNRELRLLPRSRFVRYRVSRNNQKSLWGHGFSGIDVRASRISAHHAQNKPGSRALGRCRSLMMTFWRRAHCVTLKQEHSKTICCFSPSNPCSASLWRTHSPTKLSHTCLLAQPFSSASWLKQSKKLRLGTDLWCVDTEIEGEKKKNAYLIHYTSSSM